ncbi:MAG: 50S ribosomal protein L4 [Acutalibacteraceae bacterium]|nr:50S ribosomal protein L4 [Acutalibacteraceae bacterium]
MANVAILDMAGKNVGELTLNDAVFGIEPNAVVMHEAVVNYLANQRQGTQSTLTRTEVSGGGKKPWRQKGTGHARQGSTRAPQWRHGGIVHAPKPRDYSYVINKKERRLALKSALSDKVLTGSLIVLDALTLDSYSTKTVAECLKAIGAAKKTLIVLENNDSFAVKSAANIEGVKTAQYNTISTYDIVNADSLVIVKNAVAKIEEVYA